MRYIEPLVRRVWSDAAEEYVDSYEIEGYCVKNELGEVLGTGESRDQALEAAQRFILLPSRKTHV